MSIAKPTQRIILFDIDDTLMDFNYTDSARWTGGTETRWQQACKAIKFLDIKHNTNTKFGLLTFKDREDPLTDAVQGRYVAGGERPFKANETSGLKDFLDNSLVTFTAGGPKQDAMHKIMTNTKKTPHEITSPKDVWIVDDNRVAVCEMAAASGFTAIHADVVRPNKNEEANAVDRVINAMLTLANKNKPTTVLEVLAESARVEHEQSNRRIQTIGEPPKQEKEHMPKKPSEPKPTPTLATAKRQHGHINPEKAIDAAINLEKQKATQPQAAQKTKDIMKPEDLQKIKDERSRERLKGMLTMYDTKRSTFKKMFQSSNRKAQIKKLSDLARNNKATSTEIVKAIKEIRNEMLYETTGKRIETRYAGESLLEKLIDEFISEPDPAFWNDQPKPKSGHTKP